MEDFLDVSFLTHQLNMLIQEESDIVPTSSQITVALGADFTIEIETADTTTEGEVQHRGKNRNYQFCTTYPTLQEAEEVLKLEKVWSRIDIVKSKTPGGYTKITYRCNLVAYRESRCRSQVRIHLHSETTEASIHRTYCKNSHCMYMISVCIIILYHTKVAMMRIGILK